MLDTPTEPNEATGALRTPIRVDVVSDVMCPWCLIGKRRLEKAMTATPDLDWTVIWRPYQLDPTLPPEGKPRQQYLDDKFGRERATAFYERIAEEGRKEGIDFAFDKIEVSPNTLDAHRMLRWAVTASPHIQNMLKERLLTDYFIEGRNVADYNVLLNAADAVGLDARKIAPLLASDLDRDAVRDEIAYLQKIGVSGVPTFIFDETAAVSGAQDGDTLVQVARQVIALREEKPQA